jgi:hypothetical protein
MHLAERVVTYRRVGPSAERFRRNIELLRLSCRLAFGKSQDKYYVFITVAKDRKRAAHN